MAVRALVSGALLTAGSLAIYLTRLDAGVEPARGAALAAIVLGSLGLVWAERALDRPWATVGIPRRPRFWVVCGLVGASVPLFLLVPPLAAALAIGPLAARDWILAAAVAVAAVAWRPMFARRRGDGVTSQRRTSV
jgi:hypothetical protein